MLKASANIGNIGGQLAFGFLGDAFGRRFVYGKELFLVILGLIVMISVPHSLGGHAVVTWVTVTRVIMGMGIGGDYPLSAAVMADRAGMKRRGPLLALVFAAQGWGGVIGAILSVIVVASYKGRVQVCRTLRLQQPAVHVAPPQCSAALRHAPNHALRCANSHCSAQELSAAMASELHARMQGGNVGSLDAAWRILLGIGLAPALAVLPMRLLLKESTRFKEARRLQVRQSFQNQS